jgi:CheY-like chemotaxis protein
MDLNRFSCQNAKGGTTMDDRLALIVEDHQDIATVFSAALQAIDFETEIIGSGDLALTRLAATTPDLVVLDLNLPRVTGAEILHHIRADARLKGIRVIIATAYPDIARGLEDEADLVLLKPITFRQMRDLAARMMSSTPPSWAGSA